MHLLAPARHPIAHVSPYNHLLLHCCDFLVLPQTLRQCSPPSLAPLLCIPRLCLKSLVAASPLALAIAASTLWISTTLSWAGLQSTSPALNHPTPPPVPRRWTQAIAGGFKNVEFTLTTPDALQHVSDFRAKYDYKMVGCGTVMNVKDAEEVRGGGHGRGRGVHRFAHSHSGGEHAKDGERGYWMVQ